MAVNKSLVVLHSHCWLVSCAFVIQVCECHCFLTQVTSPTNHLPIHDIEVDGHGEGEAHKEFIPPDWDLMSPQGLMAVLQIAVSVFTKVGVFVGKSRGER